MRHMTEIVTFRQVSFDTLELRPDERVGGAAGEAVLFDPSRDSEPGDSEPGRHSVMSYDERAIIRWLMEPGPVRELILGEIGLPLNSRSFLETTSPFYKDGEGDLDLILYHVNRLAVALECKRIKAENVTAGEDRINKLQGTARGVQQVNRLYEKFGFHQTWLAIITEVFAASQDEATIVMRGLSPGSLQQLIHFPDREKLRPEIGILFIEVVQPSHTSFDKRGSVLVSAHHRAVSRDQTDDVTNRLKELLSCQ